jgi:type VII secretion protein EccB
VASRRDQLQSYQFLTQRVISAFVSRETDPAQSPLRRGIGAVFAGLMIAVMVGAGFGVVGILTKSGSNNWRTEGGVVIEKETGASFLYRDGVLHPMLNYSSALLAAGKVSAVFHEAANSLAGTPRGAAFGIPGAPDSLPDRGKELKLPWTLCSAASTGGKSAVVKLVVGQGPVGGQALGDRGLLVTEPATGNSFLIVQGRRYQLGQPSMVIPSLFGAATPVPVGKAWLNGLPVGSDIGPIGFGDRKGQPSTKVPGQHVGDFVFTQTGSGPQYFVVFDDGLASLNELQTDIYKGQSATQAVELPLAQATALPRSGQLKAPTGDSAPPTRPPALLTAEANAQVCAVSQAPGAPPGIVVGGSVDDAGPGTVTASSSDVGAVLADRVVVPGGHIAVIRAVDSPSATTGAYYLVTDVGIRYPVPSDAALQMLGYLPTDAVTVLADLVLRIPAGPALDPAAAVRPASASGTGG